LAADGLTILVGNSDRDRGIVVLLSAANPLSIRCQSAANIMLSASIICQSAANIRCQSIIYPLPIRCQYLLPIHYLSAANIRCQSIIYPLPIRCQYLLPIHYLSAANIRCQSETIQETGFLL
jgi:hypothetical protein